MRGVYVVANIENCLYVAVQNSPYACMLVVLISDHAV